MILVSTMLLRLLTLNWYEEQLTVIDLKRLLHLLALKIKIHLAIKV